MPDKFSNVLAEELAKRQFLVVGDGDHDEPAIGKTMLSAESFAAMRQQAVKHLFLEQSIEINAALQAYQDGKMSEADFRTQLGERIQTSVPGTNKTAEEQEVNRLAGVDNMVAAADLARTHGIRMHFAEMDAGGELINQSLLIKHRAERELTEAAVAEVRKHFPEEYSKLTRNDPDLTQKMVELYANSLEKMTDAERQTYTEEGRRIMAPYEEAREKANKARMDGDKDLAEHIKSIAGNDKAVIFYGASHGYHTNDLDDYLGQDRTARLILGKNSSAISLLRPDVLDKTRGPDPKPPVGLYLIDEQRYIRTTPEVIDAEVNAFCAHESIDMSALAMCKPAESAPTDRQPQRAVPSGPGAPN